MTTITNVRKGFVIRREQKKKTNNNNNLAKQRKNTDVTSVEIEHTPLVIVRMLVNPERNGS